MALIRNSNAALIARDAVVLDLGDLQRQGAAIMERARAESARIVTDAKGERERILAGAHEEGRAAGYAAGLAEGRTTGAEQARSESLAARQQDLEKLIGAWTQALSEFSAARDSFVQAAERDVIRLALSIAEKLVKRRIELEPDIVLDQVRSALSTVIRPTEAVLAVHPGDRQLVEQAMGGLLAQFPAIRNITLIDDAALHAGSCVARMRDPETAGLGGGEVDASIATQLDRIVAVLLPGERRGDISH